MRAPGVLLVAVQAPSLMGLRLDIWSTLGEKDIRDGAVEAVVMGMYMGAKAGLVGLEGGVTRVVVV